MSKKTPTKAESDHMGRVAELGCVACMVLGYEGTPAEIHHLRDGAGAGQRSGHFRVIPLCPFHHRQGPDAFHISPARFQRKFGNEADLLKKIERML